MLGPIALVAIVVPGLYMVTTGAGWRPWVLVGIATYALIAAAGAFTGISVARGRMGVGPATASWLIRIGLALGVVFDMTVKPDWPIAVAAVAVGAAAGFALSAMRRRAEVAA